MLYPLNKYLVVQPIEEKKTETGVLVPDNFKIDERKFKMAKVIQPNKDSLLLPGMKIIVPSHMIEETSFFDKTYYLVLENYVVGF